MWERACSRMRCVSHWIGRLIHRIREQARSHIFKRARTDYSMKVTTPPANDCTRASDSTR